MIEVILSQFLDIFKYCAPALIVIWLANNTLKSYFKNNTEDRQHQKNIKFSSTTLPMRIQAYERMTLFLERNTLSNLLIRNANTSLKAKEYARSLASNLNTEFEHNLVQQLYISDECWELINEAKDEFILALGEAVEMAGLDKSALAVNDALVQMAQDGKLSSNRKALAFLKQESKQLIHA